MPSWFRLVPVKDYFAPGAWYNTIMNLPVLLRDFIQRHDLIPRHARVIVGVSGGPDSLALLHALRRLAPKWGWQLHVAHLNHGLRPEAEAEAHFVAELAAAWELGCTVEQEDVQALATHPGISIEEAARQARYAFLGRVAQRLCAPVVVVGHHADDQVETMLMHLLRGSGLAGLRGMSPSVALEGLHLSVARAAHQDEAWDFSGIQLVRPMLLFSRQEILSYCQENALEPRWDVSNLDATYFRNRLRHQIIPQLKAINPNLNQVLTRTAFVLQGDYQVLQMHRDALWAELVRQEPGRVRLQLCPFRKLPRGDQRALLRRAIITLRPEHRNISWEHTEQVLELLAAKPQQASGGPYTLTAGLEAWLSYQWLDVQESHFIPVEAPQIPAEQQLQLPGEVTLGSRWRLVARQEDWAPGATPWQIAPPTNDTIWLPIDIPQPLTVRPRHPGDKMRPLGLGAEKSIKDLMNTHKIPRSERVRWPLLVDAKGRILWLVGRRVAEWAQVHPDSGRAWKISLSNQ